MLETVEATIDHFGRVTLNEKIRLDRKHKALVTILDEEPASASNADFELIGSVEIVGDLESADEEIAAMFRRSIERSAKELNQ